MMKDRNIGFALPTYYKSHVVGGGDGQVLATEMMFLAFQCDALKANLNRLQDTFQL